MLTSEVIGGIDENLKPKVVEIDDSYFIPPKCQKKSERKKECIFAGIERGSGRYFVVPVEDNMESTLQPLVERSKIYFPSEHLINSLHTKCIFRFSGT